MTVTSIIPGLLLLSCGAHARIIFHSRDENTSLQPIMSQSRRTRICTELCLAGLGGAPCGDSCYDLIPTNLPLLDDDQDEDEVQNDAGSVKYNATTRKGSCDVLCKNRLGFPLCDCTYDSKTYDTNFVEICSSFCVNYNYQIYGCQDCSVYKKYLRDNNNSSVSAIKFGTMSFNLASGGKVSLAWSRWCNEMCSNENGGAACNCDLLP